MSSKAVYIDTSAYLSILLNEKGSEALRKKIAKYNLCTSVVLFVESERNLLRLARTGDISSDDFITATQRLKADLDIFLVLNLTLETIHFGQFPNVSLPRSLDLIHLRAAQYFAKEIGLIGFLSTDKQQLRAAEELGLPIL